MASLGDQPVTFVILVGTVHNQRAKHAPETQRHYVTEIMRRSGLQCCH